MGQRFFEVNLIFSLFQIDEESLTDILEQQFLLLYHKILTWDISETLPIAELNWIWFRFVKQKKDEEARQKIENMGVAPPPSNNNNGGIVPMFEFVK